MLPDRALWWTMEVLGPGSRVVSTQPLGTGRWHVNHALVVVGSNGRTRQVVLRRWGREGWELEDPDYTVEREVKVLTLLAGTDVPAPAVIAADPSGARCDVPALLLTRLPGHPPKPAGVDDLAGFCRQLAETLAAIHDLGSAPELPAYRLYYDRAHAEPAPFMPPSPIWTRSLAAVRQAPESSTTTLIHRDYHPENTLWSKGRLSGVVDWTQASVGPPELDLGHMRWNLVADYGQEVADRFLVAYRAATGSDTSHQWYWDLVALFDLLLADGDDPGDVEPDDLRRFENYAQTVLATG